MPPDSPLHAARFAATFADGSFGVRWRSIRAPLFLHWLQRGSEAPAKEQWRLSGARTNRHAAATGGRMPGGARKTKNLRPWDRKCPTSLDRLAGMKNKRSKSHYGVLVLSPANLAPAAI